MSFAKRPLVRPRFRLSQPLLLAAFALGLAGCDRTSPDAGRAADASGKSAPAAANRPAEVRLGYFANLTHAQGVLGVASGEFQQAVAPAKLTTRVFNAGPALIEALFAGEIDIAYVGPSPALNAHFKTRGQGIRIIAGAAANGVVIVARGDGGIQTLADLKGKKVATPQLGNTQDISARHYLVHKLGQANADNVLPIANAEQLAMLQRGQIDAAWAPEPWGARLVHEAGGKLLAEEKDLWPNKRFTLTLVVTTPEFLAKHPDIVRNVLVVHRNWTKRLRTEPDKYLPQLGAALNELTGKKLPPQVFADALRRTEFTDEPLAETLQTFAQWAHDLGFSKQPPDLTGLVDTTILKSLGD